MELEDAVQPALLRLMKVLRRHLDDEPDCRLRVVFFVVPDNQRPIVSSVKLGPLIH